MYYIFDKRSHLLSSLVEKTRTAMPRKKSLKNNLNINLTPSFSVQGQQVKAQQ